jgi:hypothetical protein
MHRLERMAGVTLAGALLAAACSGSKSYDDVYVTSDAGEAGETALGPDLGAGAAAATAGGAGGAPGEGAAGSPIGGVGTAGANLGVDGELLYFKASNPDPQDWFGSVLAISGNWLAVSAPHESSRATGLDGDQADDSEDRSGAVYLYSRDALGWAQRAYVKASTVRAGDGFGQALAFSGQTLVVGAPFEDSPSTGINGSEDEGPGGNHGAAYVFVEKDGQWQQQAYVKATNTDWIDLFGTSVAVSGHTLVVGAPWEDSAASGVDGDQQSDTASASGAAYVYERSGDEWAPLAYLKASNTEVDDEFGKAVALSGETLVVGAPGESSSGNGPGALGTETDNAAPDSGAVYVFQRGGASYEQVAYLKASNSDDDDEFGYALALDGDTLAVAAVGEATANGDGLKSNELLPDSGAVYVFERQAGEWSQSAYLKAAVPAADQYFGMALALSGDTLVVGALGEDSPELPSSGAAHVYTRTGSGWTLKERFTAPNADPGDGFGASVAITPTLLAVGASYEAGAIPGINGDWSSNDTPQAGAAFLFRRN